MFCQSQALTGPCPVLGRQTVKALTVRQPQAPLAFALLLRTVTVYSKELCTRAMTVGGSAQDQGALRRDPEYRYHGQWLTNSADTMT